MVRLRSAALAAAVVSLTLVGVPDAHAASVIVVPTNRPTIQSAVNAAPAGAMIKVCRGTYVEQVTIPAGKDGLTLFSAGDLQAVIKAPPVMTSPKAIVRVSGAQNVTIRHFTITGPGGGSCDSLEFGVRVDSGGSATITDNHITQIRDTPFSGCQNGVGVLVGRNFESTSGSGTVVHNLIDNYQKGGVVVDGQLAPLAPASHAEIAYNEVDGIGPTAVIAQNGIQVSRGAVADVHHNVVKNNVYSLSAFADEGILLYQVSSSQTRIHHNDVCANNDGIGLYTTSNTEVGWNRSHDNAPYDGIFADVDTSNNTIEHNKLFNNAEFDCDDITVGTYVPAMTANPWIQDLGYTENRPGLCKHATP
jgi:nitrous oxidase accessory protein NosD